LYKTLSKNIQRGVSKKGGRSRLSTQALKAIQRSDKKFSAIGSTFVGKIVKGRVFDVVKHGAVIDVDGVRCFIHISEFSEQYVSDPAEVLSIGEIRDFKVLEKKLDKWQKMTFVLSLLLEDKVVPTKRSNKFSNNPFTALKNLKD